MFVRVDMHGGRLRVKLVRGFRGPDGRVRQRVFALPSDPSGLRRLGWALLDVARRLEQQSIQAAARPAAGTVPTPQGPVISTSPHPSLRLMGGPRGTVVFVNGRYTACDPDEITWLQTHPDFGVRFREEPIP